MKSLARYYFNKIVREYQDWLPTNSTHGTPGRVILSEFDSDIVSEIFDTFHSSDLKISEPGSEDGIILLLEDHEIYVDIKEKKYSFADLTRERNRAGKFFCVMFIAETKPTHEQVASIHQESIYEEGELEEWVNISLSYHAKRDHFPISHTRDIAKFLNELTHKKWNHRPSIKLKEISSFIASVIDDTIQDGLFWDALGRNFTKLGGINRLDNCRKLEGAKSKYRSIFRKEISNTLIPDQNFWRAVYKDREVEKSEIEDNLKDILEEDSIDYSCFCQSISAYFESYFANRPDTSLLQQEIKDKFDSTFPFTSVLHAKKTKSKLQIGGETKKFLLENDVNISENDELLLESLDSRDNKPDRNEIRSFYFPRQRLLSTDPKLDKAWKKEVSSSKDVECSNLLDGILKVLSSYILLTDIGNDSVLLRQRRDRRKSSLQKKNVDALNFFLHEYKDLDKFWSLFGDKFELDIKVFEYANDLADEKLKVRSGKQANILEFEILLYSIDPKSPSQVWHLKWIFDHNGFESIKHYELNHLKSRRGYYHKHELAIDPLFVKRADKNPSIKNKEMFQASGASRKPGSVVKKTDKPDDLISKFLKDLQKHGRLSEHDLNILENSYEKFYEDWKQAIDLNSTTPITSDLTFFNSSFNSFIDLIDKKTLEAEHKRELFKHIKAAHTISVKDTPNYLLYLPWSPFSLLMTWMKNKIFHQIAGSYKNGSFRIGNLDDGVFPDIITELVESFGNTFYINDHSAPLISTASICGYYEFSSLADSRNSLSIKEIKNVMNSVLQKFLEVYPNQRDHIDILFEGIGSFEHLFAIYEEALKFSSEQEDHFSIRILFHSKNNREFLDLSYERITETFNSHLLDTDIKIVIVDNIESIEENELDLIFSFDPLSVEKKLAQDSEKFCLSNENYAFWEYCNTRKLPSNKLSLKSSFAVNNHRMDSVSAVFHKISMITAARDRTESYCFEVSQDVIKNEFSKSLKKCTWLIVYDYLLSKETCAGTATGANSNRVLRYVQGEGTKRSMAIVTSKDIDTIKSKISNKLRDLNLSTAGKVSSLCEELFSISNSFSGDTLLKTSGNGNFSHDLIGNVGTIRLVESLFENARKIAPIFWVHLDDYVNWFKSSTEDDSFRYLGKKRSYISDLLGIFLDRTDDKISLNLIVCESKLTNGSDDQKIKSCKQLVATCSLIKGMLASSKLFDYKYWVNKFLEFVIENFDFNPNLLSFHDLMKVNAEDMDIFLSGISSILLYGDNSEETRFEKVKEENYLRQIIVSTEDTRKIFDSISRGEHPVIKDLYNNLEPIKLNSSSLLGHIVAYPKIDNTQKIPERPSSEVKEVNETDNLDNTTEEALPVSRCLSLLNKAINFLDENTLTVQDTDPVNIDRVQEGIRTIFSHHNLPSKFLESQTTPNSVVIKVAGNIKISAKKVLSMRDNFVSVASLHLRKVYPEPGCMVLVFDRNTRERVLYVSLLRESLKNRRTTLELDFNNKIILGLDEFKKNICYYRLDGPSPHALVGGQTKSGKSVLMNNMIMDLILTNDPKYLKLRLFDPKQVEFSSYSEAPHLAHPVVVDKQEAVHWLKDIEDLMNARYESFSKLNLKDIESYNNKYPENRMSRHIVFFDELADWILDDHFKENAKDIIIRVSSKGRAAGVHLVIATQRPSNDVVFPLLRANLDTKIALKVDRDQNSVIILGESGAEDLLGYGHGIIKTEGETHYIQGGFTEASIFEQLIDLAIEFWRNQ
ncbi:MAG: FtsK/SpoIIIE domain-containing protein [Oligoflexus sp.]